MVETKVCSGCNEELGHWRFFKHQRNKDGLQSQCKDCMRKRRKLREDERKAKANGN